MSEIIFSLEKDDPRGLNVKFTLKGPQEEVGVMLFTAMNSNKIVFDLILKTVAGYCFVNKIKMADIENFYNANP